MKLDSHFRGKFPQYRSYFKKDDLANTPVILKIKFGRIDL